MINVEFRVENLRRDHQRESFDCGESSLNEFLYHYARQNNERGLGRTFVAVANSQPSAITGYYTLANSSVSFEQVPEKLPRYPIPVLLIGRLAVALTAQGKGIGKLLLYDAFQRSLIITKETGIFAVEVYALNEAARDFYLKFNFQPLLDDPFHLYLPMKTVRKLFGS